MNLQHHSDTPGEIDISRISNAGYRRRDKPNGFWVSVEGEHDWPTHLASFGHPRPAFRHRVELAPDARILLIDSPEALLSFSLEQSLRIVHDEPVPFGEAIDWDWAEGDWQGILITPFQFTLRRDQRCRWYYGWDCASGCIWDPAAILAITAAEEELCSSSGSSSF